MSQKTLRTALAALVLLPALLAPAFAQDTPLHRAGDVLPAGEPPFAQSLVGGVSPSGTTIDLFDYWVTAQKETYYGNNTATGFLSQGINNGHALLFGKGMRQNTNNIGEWNKWTRSARPCTGIVASRLGGDGYPRLALTIPADTALTTTDGSQSLAYLFDPALPAQGKEAFADVQGLLQVDENGYYYFNSQENYAVFYPEDNSFALYQHPGVRPGGNSPVGQFFPFNAATADGEAVSVNGQEYRLMNAVDSNSESLNHYFGMHMSTRFVQQNGGFIDGSPAAPVTYEFSGDDDVWVFIDGVLVADLGGIHNLASVKIDFSTGHISINGQQQPQTLGALLGGAPGSTLPDDTYHTLDFFYLERGNVDSNLKLRYNLVTIPESSLIKVDQLGNAVAGARFALYGARDYAARGEGATPVATGETDHNGAFVFLDERDFPITLDALYNSYGHLPDDAGNHLILQETGVPAGYRAAQTVGLYFYTSAREDVLLLSRSVWDKGACAMPRVTVTAPNEIRLLDPPAGGGGAP